MGISQFDDGFHSDVSCSPFPRSTSSETFSTERSSLDCARARMVDQRKSVLSFGQVRKLHEVMSSKVTLQGRGNFPTLEVPLKELVLLVRRKLETDISAGGAKTVVNGIRLNGGAASHVLSGVGQPYNDLDLIFTVELSSPRMYDRVKAAVLNTILDLLPDHICKHSIYASLIRDAYVGKMVKVNNNRDGDRWSLISLGTPGQKNVELKFVDAMHRQFEFSVDSFQIVLDSLFLFYDCAVPLMCETFYPTVIGESMYGDFQESLFHLENKLISTRQPEEIRGGGLLKYCNLLVRNYEAVNPKQIKSLERYMCSRFFIDFPDINSQESKLLAYLRNHFCDTEEESLQFRYLMHLREVVESSTVCLMVHERRQTLNLIQNLAKQVFYKGSEYSVKLPEPVKDYCASSAAELNESEISEKMRTIDAKSRDHKSINIVSLNWRAPNFQPAYAQPPAANISPVLDIDTQKLGYDFSGDDVANATRGVRLQFAPPKVILSNGIYYTPILTTSICTCNNAWLATT